jgi:homoserine dehydrogenase
VDAVGIGLLGCGVVGSAMTARLAADPRIDIAGVAVRQVDRPRPCPLPAFVTDDALAVVEHDAVDVVVEVMGPIGPSQEAVERALALGKPVVTANKALLARHGPRLRHLAAEAGVGLHFEAAVAGGVPVIRLLQALAAGDTITRIEGVLNGTVNYVLGRIEQGDDMAEAVAAAQEAGLAEADPTADLSGADSADKLAVLAQLAFATSTTRADVDVFGIDWLTTDDVARAAADGKRWRLVGVANRGGCCRVEPVLLDEADPLARLAGPENAVAVSTEHTGTVVVTGLGAGGPATATSVVADVAAAAADVARRSPRGLSTTTRR